MLLCFVRIEEMVNIDISESIIGDKDQTAAKCFPPKQSRMCERYDLMKTSDLRICSTETFYVWLVRLGVHF